LAAAQELEVVLATSTTNSTANALTKTSTFIDEHVAADDELESLVAATAQQPIKSTMFGKTKVNKVGPNASSIRLQKQGTPIGGGGDTADDEGGGIYEQLSGGAIGTENSTESLYDPVHITLAAPQAPSYAAIDIDATTTPD
jgi:hypothetical protein